MKPDSSTNTMLACSRAPLFYARPILAPPPVGRLRVLFPGPHGRLLRREAQDVQQARDMAAMVVDAELSANHRDDPGARPQVGVKPRFPRALLENLRQFPPLFLRQLRRRP